MLDRDVVLNVANANGAPVFAAFFHHDRGRGADTARTATSPDARTAASRAAGAPPGRSALPPAAVI